jgi:anti-sigma regulatory factor (Ser/Thr protein kinase)
MVSEWTKVFADDSSSISLARHATDSYLAAWGLGDDRFVVSLLVSEIMTNAVRHGAGPIELHVRLGDERLRVAVTDHGGGQPAMREPDPHDPASGGRGLRMVHDTAEDWGIETGAGLTTVWFEHQLSTPAPEAADPL